MKNVLRATLLVALCGLATNVLASVTTISSPNLILEGAPEPNAIVSPFTYTGTTVGGPTFNRPLANGNNAPTSLSAVGTAVAYDVVSFSVATSGTYSFIIYS